MSTPRSARPGDPGQTGQTGQAAGEPAGTGWAPAYQDDRDDRTGFGPNFASSAWPAFLAAAMGAIVLGIVLLAWPKATLAIVAILIGASLVVAGLLRIIDGFTAHDATGGRRAAHVLIGLLAIIVGLYCIRHYHVTIAALAIIVGLFWILHGIADIAAGLFAGPFPARWLTILAGFLSLFAGLIVLFWPTISLTVLVVVIGVWLLVYGVLMAITAFALRRTGSSADRLASA
jgi:uncharacterized membrane protein HdeD (DUF308 family)